MDSKKQAIRKLKAVCQIALMFKSPEAMSVGTLKMIDVIESDDEQQAIYDIEDAAFMILKIICESLNERHAADEIVEDYFWDVFHAVKRTVEKFESPGNITMMNRIYRDLKLVSPAENESK